MKWLRQLFCAHVWQTRYKITRDGTVISTRCDKCGKAGKPDHFWPRHGDLIEADSDIELIDELKELQ